MLYVEKTDAEIVFGENTANEIAVGALTDVIPDILREYKAGLRAASIGLIVINALDAYIEAEAEKIREGWEGQPSDEELREEAHRAAIKDRRGE